MKDWDASRVGALSGVRVLDLSRFIAGPMCAQNLGDLGAEVVKVERIGGEDTRNNEPQYGGKSLYTALFNRNKRGMTIDTRNPDGQELLRSLAGWADVLVENFRPGTLEKMGLGEEVLNEINPGLIVVSISGFGQSGPNSERVLFDCIAQAMSGLMHLNAQPDGPPQLTKIFPADSMAAMYGTVGALAALHHKQRTGEGQRIDVSVYDSLFSSLGTSIPAYLVNGELPPRNGNRDDYNAPANLFPTRDGYVYLHAGTQAFWARFCHDIIGRPELVDDARYNSVPARMAHKEQVEALVSGWTAKHSSEDVSAAFVRAEVPCGVVADISTAATDSHAWDRDMLIRTTDTEGDELVLLGNPMKLSRTPPEMRHAPPQPGEHTEEVLSEALGLADDKIKALREKGVV